MQNEPMRCSEGGHNLHEGALNTERGERVQSRSLRNSKVRPTQRRASQSGNGSGVGAEAHQLSGTVGPPALLEYSNDDADSGEDSDGDEMDEEELYMEQEGTAADRSMNDQSDISDSEGEGEEQEDQDLDGSQWEECCSSDAAKLHLAASKRQQRGECSARHQNQSRKRRQLEQDCSVNDQYYAAEVKRLKESKLKHNKNEQIRRKDMKDAVHKLRNQLRRKTKKPSTISVLKAAKQEIDELTSIKEEEDRELDRLRQKELFLKYQLESLVSEREKLLSSSGAGIAVSPMRVGVVGAGSFVPPPAAANPAVAAAVPQPIHSRPTLPQLPLFPMVPPMVPHSTAAATLPTAVGRVGVIDHQQPVGGAPTTIFPPGLASVSRIPLPRPPNLVPFNPTGTCTNNLPSTPSSSSTSSGSVSILPTASFSPNIIPGLSPAATALHIMSPSRTTTQTGLPNIMYRGLASPFLMQYHPAVVGRLPTTAVSGVIGAAGLMPAHTPASLGRISMNPTLPFCLPTAAALCPPPLLGVAGFNHYGATNPSTQLSSTATSLQFTRNAESMQAHTNVRSGRSSGDESNMQHTSEFAFNTGSKNGNPSAEAYNTGNNNTSSREASAEVSQHSSLHTIMAGHNSEVTRIQQRNSNDHHGCDDSCTESKITTNKSGPRVFHRYGRNGVIRVSENSPKHLLTVAPPLLKVVDLEDSDQSSQKLIETIDQRELHEHNQQWQASLQAVPALKNPKVISTVIKHFKPQPKAIYMDIEGCNRFENFRCSRNGEQRSRISNSLSSGDEAPDSPHRKCNGSEQSMYCCNKLNGWNCLCYSSQVVTSKRECLPAVSHKNLQYRSLRKKKSGGFLRHRQS